MGQEWKYGIWVGKLTASRQEMLAVLTVLTAVEVEKNGLI